MQGYHPVWQLKVVVANFRCRLRHVVVGIVPMERSSSSYNSEPQSRVMHLCNVKASLVTSWTKDNPGRHFYDCGLYKIRNNVYRWLCYGFSVDFWVYFGHVGYM